VSSPDSETHDAPRRRTACYLYKHKLSGFAGFRSGYPDKIKSVIKTIIFDLGRVIVPFDYHRGYHLFSEFTGLSPDDVRQRITATGLVPKLESGQIEPRPFVDAIAKSLGVSMTYEQFSQMWGSIFLPEPLVPEDFIRRLRQQYRILMLSNTNAIHCETLFVKYPLLALFDERVLSHEVGAMKPATAIYEAALAKAGCQANECFFTDDVQEYVDAARRLGIDAVQFQSYEQIARVLRSRGVDC
jgi:glucose-1-phosphatase